MSGKLNQSEHNLKNMKNWKIFENLKYALIWELAKKKNFYICKTKMFNLIICMCLVLVIGYNYNIIFYFLLKIMN